MVQQVIQVHQLLQVEDWLPISQFNPSQPKRVGDTTGLIETEKPPLLVLCASVGSTRDTRQIEERPHDGVPRYRSQPAEWGDLSLGIRVQIARGFVDS